MHGVMMDVCPPRYVPALWVQHRTVARSFLSILRPNTRVASHHPIFFLAVERVGPAGG